MATSLVDAETLLAIDVGTANTRAFLFDVVEGQYHFIAVGSAPTTAEAPYKNVSEGVRLALGHLQDITGRIFIDENERLVVPSQVDGSGVDKVVATLSAGPALKVITVGLLADVSLQSAQHLIDTTYAELKDSLSLTDRRKSETQIDAIIAARPDLIVVAGGMEGGASRSVMDLLETIGLACYLMPAEVRPKILYAGNQDLIDKVKGNLASMVDLHIAPNVRPSFDVEDIDPAQEVLAKVSCQIRSGQIGGIRDLDILSNGWITPSANAYARVIRFLSQIYDPSKGVLGVDLGAGSTTIAVGMAGKLTLRVNSSMGTGEGLTGFLKQLDFDEIRKWLSMHVPEDYIQDYLYHKSLFPSVLPVTLEDLSIEQALARVLLRRALKNMNQTPIANMFTSAGTLNAPFEPIIASGAVLTRAPSQAQSLLILLDALQPQGVTTLVLDQNNLTAALGAVAPVNSIAPVQIIESGAYLTLGMVVNPISDAKYGTPILRARLAINENEQTRVEIKQGSLTLLPLARGQAARLTLEPLGHTDAGLGRKGKGGSFKVVGGVFGVVIDARGRPLNLPDDDSRRRDLLKKWLFTLGNIPGMV